MTFRTSWGISFHEYLVPLFSVRVSLRTRRTSSVDPERPSSCRPRPHPREFHPYPVETQVDPGRIRVGDPERPSSGRPRPHPRKVQPYPVETQVDPGRIRVGELDWPASSRTDRPLSGRRRSKPNGPHRSKPEWTSSGRPRADLIRANTTASGQGPTERNQTDLIGRKPNGTHPVDPEGSHPVEARGNASEQGPTASG